MKRYTEHATPKNCPPTSLNLRALLNGIIPIPYEFEAQTGPSLPNECRDQHWGQAFFKLLGSIMMRKSAFKTVECFKMLPKSFENWDFMPLSPMSKFQLLKYRFYEKTRRLFNNGNCGKISTTYKCIWNMGAQSWGQQMQFYVIGSPCYSEYRLAFHMRNRYLPDA